MWVVGLQQDEHADKEVEGIAPSTHVQDEPTAQELGQEAPIMESSLDMAVNPEMSQELTKGVADNEEKWVQTDPVTIIIGDSSFLLQQLANINKSPEVTQPQIPPRRKPGRPSGIETSFLLSDVKWLMVALKFFFHH